MQAIYNGKSNPTLVAYFDKRHKKTPTKLSGFQFLSQSTLLDHHTIGTCFFQHGSDSIFVDRSNR